MIPDLRQARPGDVVAVTLSSCRHLCVVESVFSDGCVSAVDHAASRVYTATPSGKVLGRMGLGIMRPLSDEDEAALRSEFAARGAAALAERLKSSVELQRDPSAVACALAELNERTATAPLRELIQETT